MIKLLRRLTRPIEESAAPRVDPAGGSESRARMMLTTRRFPVYYLPITKCGSTYLKNLFFHIDHGHQHPKGDGIHEEIHDLLRAGFVDAEHVRESRFAFAVLRDPMDRMLSLYFDKIWGDGPQNFASLRKTLSREIGIRLNRDLDASQHTANCILLAEWLEENLAFKTTEPVNAHWRRQSTRLKRAESMALEHLVLEGLDWQLPAFLGPALPKLSDHMAAIAARNSAPRPVSKAILVTPDLEKVVRRTYSYDTELVEAARSRWTQRKARGWTNVPPAPALVSGAATLRLTTTHRTDLTFMPVPKAGCTFLRNLAYLIDHGRCHPDPLGIQADDCLVKRAFTAEEASSRRAFIVLRDPVARFFSLYFDKVMGTGPHAFPWIAERLTERRGFHSGPDLGVEEHRQNCFKLLGFIANQFETMDLAEVNAHWRPQAHFATRARGFRLRALLLEDIACQLPTLFDNSIPNLTRLMSRIDTRNVSARPIAASDLLNGRLESRILELYGADRDLHGNTREAWSRLGRAPEV